MMMRGDWRVQTLNAQHQNNLLRQAKNDYQIERLYLSLRLRIWIRIQIHLRTAAVSEPIMAEQKWRSARSIRREIA